MKTIVAALAIMLMCTACTQRDDNSITAEELAILSGVSTAILRLPEDKLANSTMVSIVRLDGGKTHTLGSIGIKAIPIEQGHARILVSLRQQNAKRVITLFACGATLRTEIQDGYKPTFWYGQPEEYNGVYIFSSDGEVSESYKNNKGVAYGLKLNAVSNKKIDTYSK